MKKTLILAVGLACLTAHGSVLNISSSILDAAGFTSNDSVNYLTSTSVSVNTGGDVLVIGTLTSQSAVDSGEGHWRLYNANTAEQSQHALRTFDSKKDKGIASVSHIFTNVTAGTSIALQQRSAGGQLITTSGANLVAIPLTVSTGETLNHGIHKQGMNVFSTTSTSFVGTGMKTSVQLDRSANNGVYMVATFNAESLISGETGTWQMQYRKVGDLTWNDTGKPMVRTMSAPLDIGAISMFSLEEGLVPGEYEVQVAAKSETGVEVETFRGSLAAVALSYTNATGGGYFDGFHAESNVMSPVGGPYTGAQDSLTLSGIGGTNSGIFSSMSFNSSASSGANQVGGFDLFMTNATTTAFNQQNERAFDGVSDLGSGGSVGYFDNLASGDYTIFARSQNVAGPVTTSNVTLVGFSTESIPEPAVLVLVVGFGVATVSVRRVFLK